jgi:hypothetical protein
MGKNKSFEIDDSFDLLTLAYNSEGFSLGSLKETI